MNISTDARRLAVQLEVAGVAGEDVANPHAIQARIDSVGLEATMAVLNEKYDVYLSVGPYLIASASEEGFWNNDFGWVGDRDSASGFLPEDPARSKPLMLGLPGDVRFVHYDQAEDLFSEAADLPN